MVFVYVQVFCCCFLFHVSLKKTFTKNIQENLILKNVYRCSNLFLLIWKYRKNRICGFIDFTERKFTTLYAIASSTDWFASSNGVIYEIIVSIK